MTLSMPVKQRASANKNTDNLFHPLNKIQQLRKKILKSIEGLFSLDHANEHKERRIKKNITKHPLKASLHLLSSSFKPTTVIPRLLT